MDDFQHVTNAFNEITLYLHMLRIWNEGYGICSRLSSETAMKSGWNLNSVVSSV